ncbi:MAG: dihydrofolate reductase [Chloroflexi bacterium]|nr:MAG: dihydrofolate reductase [Chloroflexota bacterium]
MRVVVVENLTLDRVMQAPGRADEDVRGGFQHGGWGLPYYDPVAPRVMGERMQGEGALLLGRRTYLDLADVWPKRTNNPFTERLNNSQKYVASRTLKEPLPWMNSTLLEGDAAEAVARLKPKPGNLTIIGSGALAQSLMRRNLIDEYLLSSHPLVLGSGLRLFPDGVFWALRLIESIPTTTGVVIATYQPGDMRPTSPVRLE